MAWTQSDADAVRAAITQLAIGQRKVTVSFAGPPSRSITYEMVQLQELRDLLAEIESSVTRAAGGSTYRLGATRTGL